MARGITHSCAHIWRHIARAGGWWSVLRVAREWDGVFGMAEIEEHLTTLKRSGFLAAMEYRREGTVYAYTPQCRQLPGETLVAVTSAAPVDQTPGCAAVTAAAAVAAAPQHNAMTGAYVPPPMPTARAGALDHTRYPSLQQGKRNPYRGAMA